jgi:hypothetical protein
MSKPLSRRRFVAGLGASLLAAPFVSLLRGRASAAPGDGVAKRLVVVFTPNGTIPSKWRPTGSGSSFSFPAGSILEPLATYKDKLVVIDGLDFREASNHEGGMSHMLTGGGAAGNESLGMSVDQFVASRLSASGGTRFPSLELGVQTSAWGGGVQTRMSYSGPGTYVPPDDSPSSVYTRLFGDAGGTPDEVDANLRRRQSVIDLVRGELTALESALGNEEKAKLDAHLTAVREMERGLGGGGGDCGSGPAIADLDPYDNDSFPALGKAQTDLMVAALACDATRVASIQWSHTVGPPVFTWLGITDGHHGLSHAGDGDQGAVGNLVKAERWFSEQFAYLLDKMAAVPDPVNGGSLLDSSLVVWCKEMGDSRLHVCEGVPFVLAGGGNGAFELGRFLQFDGESHTRLLVSICRAMGLDNQTFGNPGFGTGELPGLV